MTEKRLVKSIEKLNKRKKKQNNQHLNKCTSCRTITIYAVNLVKPSNGRMFFYIAYIVIN